MTAMPPCRGHLPRAAAVDGPAGARPPTWTRPAAATRLAAHGSKRLLAAQTTPAAS